MTDSMNIDFAWDEGSNNDNTDWPTPDYAPDRWATTRRDYTLADVEKLRGSIQIRHTLAEMGAKKLWKLITETPYVNTLGAFTGCQATQHVRAGLKAIYLSGWQVAADANNAGQMYPDQSLYPVSSVPQVIERINNAFIRQDQIQTMERLGGEETTDIDWFAPIVADAEAGFGGPLNVFELMKAMIKAGAAGVHFEDQLASEKKCGHLGGKVLLPTQQAVRNLNSARLAADVMGTPTIIMARTDAESARLITSDIDERDHEFLTGERTADGFYRITGGLEMGIARGLAYAPYADLLWMETSTPDLEQARTFAEAIRKEYPDQMLAYNCSPSFNWAKHLDVATMEKFQRELGAMGYKFQFITLAGFHSLNYATFELARAYNERGMAGYSELQQAEFAAEQHGFSATRHQHEVGTSYFDTVNNTTAGGEASTTAMGESTEKAQF
ncbi:isocitrate lyase [Aestuariispira insulae]|uniref:Isocitrate lyase n=1 Tax=Aestuariispira insulae TaxID=1461337 RepID=A0A3D9HXY4_9PROT|nr:isocitrate lyase [Aestuariispira insulae]RED54364.1 isocitrate lyase [Aestuariispira insulae]